MSTKQTQILPGINIQAPWAQLIVLGKKTVETRNYPLPKKYVGVTLAIIETPGPFKQTKKARIIGTVTFSGSFKYKSKSEWVKDRKRHFVQTDDALYAYREGIEKYGWQIEKISAFDESVAPPRKKGIVFTTKCPVLVRQDAKRPSIS